MSRTNTPHAVVVGAGVIGAAIALEPARSGLRVVVVDKAGGAGFGSTSASSAIVRFNYSTAAGVALSWEAKHYWERWDQHVGAGAGAASWAPSSPRTAGSSTIPRWPRAPSSTPPSARAPRCASDRP
jgi:glycine/D-amino acid oxidase-like deaminating enzyme